MQARSEAFPAVPGVRHSYHELPTGVRLHVAEAGASGAPAIVAAHGWPQHWWMWRGVIPVLAATHRVICPDLRGFGWSGQPADGDFAKQRLADDVLALLDALGIERAGYMGHDWGGWAGWLLGVRAPERFSRLLLVSIVHPWTARVIALLNAWRLLYQYPLAAPVLGPALVRDGRVVRMALRGAMDDAAAAVFADVLREPARAHASSCRSSCCSGAPTASRRWRSSTAWSATCRGPRWRSSTAGTSSSTSGPSSSPSAPGPGSPERQTVAPTRARASSRVVPRLPQRAASA